MKDQLNQLMSIRGMTIGKLAAQTGIPYIRLYRRFKAPDTFRLCELVKIAKALGVPVGVVTHEMTNY